MYDEGNMHPLARKINTFLMTKGELPDSVMDWAAKVYREKLGTYNEKRRPYKDNVSMSSVGKPFCQLHAEKLKLPKLPVSDSLKLKMLYGHTTEVIALAILYASGVNVLTMSEKTVLPTENGDIKGELDLIIEIDGQPSLWDIKTASPYAYDSKFSSYEKLKDNDDFGYVDQLHGYTRAARKDYPGLVIGGWIVVHKVTGEIKIVPANPMDEPEIISKISNTLKRYSEATEDNFERGYSDVAETFYKKPTGNRKLGITCSYCDFKYSCWPELEHKPNERSRSKDAFAYYTHWRPMDGGQS